MTKKYILVSLIALIALLTACKKEGSSSGFIVKMKPSELTLSPTETFKLEYSTEPELVSVTSSVWSSSNDAIVSVSQDGLVRAEASGVAVIRVNVNGQASDSCTISVLASVNKVALSKEELTLYPGKTTELSYSVIPADAPVFMEEWISDDADVVIVSSDGTVTANQIGTAHVVLKVNDAVSDTCNITVKIADEWGTGEDGDENWKEL